MNWQKSSFSGAGGENCIEIAHIDPHLLLRESDAPTDVLAMPPLGLACLIRHIKAEQQR
ncbi:DUF397 domain-containing protein [Streptomyces xiangluensis]|uniref:DUF397 domain-containing protein n=1 Tax=Streptomyces xiangluensis TaxID=2665720 RepID=A0ABV8Z4E2_9ACTN